MGATIYYRNGGLLPMLIRGGNLRSITYETPVASAQVKSAILLAGLYCDSYTIVREPAKSRDHTERMLSFCGANIEIKGLEVRIRGGKPLKPLDMEVPGDFSSASFFIVGALIIPGSEVIIKNVGINPTRTGLIDILKKMGAEIIIENIRDSSGEPIADVIARYSRLKGIEINGELLLKAIDEFPILCVAASRAEGRTKITGASELRVKESDRIKAMADCLKHMGVPVEEMEDGIIIDGVEELRGGRVKTYGDHRVAMSMVIAGIAASGKTKIKGIRCIYTSFPDFFHILNKLT
ncbi:MAG: 3-phosphoshikimate 1-carboxyvinyltransferase [Nitrospirae bacterium]|nr:MAG: 3-phosphoshikimate 1-carboxyvinyltransferase [Nitrospirota bacterium]